MCDVQCKSVAVSLLFVSAFMAVHATEMVKGQVRLLTFPSPLEYADFYGDSPEPWVRKAMYDLKTRQREAGISDVLIPANAEVELQTLPDFKTVARAKVGRDGRYCFNVKEDNRDWRVYCRCLLEEFGRKVEFVASAHVAWNKRENAYVQNLVLRRSYVSVVGRCVDANDVPVSNAVVEVALMTSPIETSEVFYHSHIARTDGNGRWRADGIDAPDFDRLISYVCNTNVLLMHDSTCPPYRISVGASTAYHAARGPKAYAVVPNVSADARTATEKFFAGYRRKTGKEWPRPAPLSDFPVSTNSVIYMPDMIMK